nr:BRO family protein [uncultured Mediterraneibacter sp.]
MDDFENRLTELHDRVIGNALSDEERTSYSESLFDSIKHGNESDEEFWYARDLQIALEYKRWDKFQNVIDKAMTACLNSDISTDDHFS